MNMKCRRLPPAPNPPICSVTPWYTKELPVAHLKRLTNIYPARGIMRVERNQQTASKIDGPMPPPPPGSPNPPYNMLGLHPGQTNRRGLRLVNCANAALAPPSPELSAEQLCALPSSALSAMLLCDWDQTPLVVGVFGLIYFSLVELDLVWFGLVWFGLVWLFVCLFDCLFVCLFECIVLFACWFHCLIVHWFVCMIFACVLCLLGGLRIINQSWLCVPLALFCNRFQVTLKSFRCQSAPQGADSSIPIGSMLATKPFFFLASTVDRFTHEFISRIPRIPRHDFASRALGYGVVPVINSSAGAPGIRCLELMDASGDA